MNRNMCLNHIKKEEVKNKPLKDYKKIVIQHQFIEDESTALLMEKELKNQIEKITSQLSKKCREVFL